MIIPGVPLDQASVALHYDELDPLYRQIWGIHLHHGLWMKGDETPQEAIENLTTFVAKSLNLIPGMNLCDIGCGYGETARMLAKEWDINVIGLTVSHAQYQFAQSLTSGNNPQFLLCDWLKNSLPSEQFDRAVSIESSEHMVDKGLFFNEAYRVLKPTGKIAVCAWLAKDKPNRAEVRYLLEPICRESRLPSMGSLEDYQTWIDQAGFKNFQFTDLTRDVKKTWSICCKRVLKAFLTDRNFRQTVLNPRIQNRAFFNTIFRMWIAYHVGSMSYGLILAEK